MELLSLLAAFAIFFVAVPAAVGSGDKDGNLSFRCAAGFVRVSMFFRIAMMFIGLLKANFSGIVIAAWVMWSLGLIVWSHGAPVLDIDRRFQNAFLRFLQVLEKLPVAFALPRLSKITYTGTLFIALTAITLLHRCWFPLHNLRFHRIETYSRTLDLEMFMHRDTALADGAAFILAPLAVFSGLFADSVIRFSGPLFSTLFVAAVALCAFRWLKSISAGVVAAALAAVWPLIVRTSNPAEISSAEIAAVYWVLGAVFIGRSPWLTVYACSTALLVSWQLSPSLAAAAAATGLAYLFTRFRRIPITRFRWIPAGAAALAAMAWLVADCRQEAPDGPFEYESAARACRSIAASFPRNEWLIISPVQELVFTYGRGWHFELLDFVSSHSAGQLTPREFSFPYDVRDIFVFVEKYPLRSPQAAGNTAGFPAVDLTQTMDRAVLAYNTGMGRASIEFQAGALLSAYGINHTDLSVFQEDERLVVFHLKGTRERGEDVHPIAKYGS